MRLSSAIPRTRLTYLKALRITSYPSPVTSHVQGTTNHLPRLLLLLLAALAFAPVPANACAVLDAELQGSYVGGCKNGLAEGYGAVTGTANTKADSGPVANTAKARRVGRPRAIATRVISPTIARKVSAPTLGGHAQRGRVKNTPAVF